MSSTRTCYLKVLTKTKTIFYKTDLQWENTLVYNHFNELDQANLYKITQL